MTGRYITTALKLAVLAGGSHGPSVLVNETKATITGHRVIWNKQGQAKPAQMKGRDELKTA